MKRPTSDPAQRPMFDARESARLDPTPAPSSPPPAPDPRQLNLDPGDRFNAAVAAECEAHAAEEHVTCPTCGDLMCLFWSDQSGDPNALCVNGHRLFPDGLP